MKLVRRLIYFSAAFILGSGALLAFFHQMGLFEVDSIAIEVIGADDDIRTRGAPAAESEIRNRLEKVTKLFAHKRVWEIDLGELKASVVRDEWVRDVLISRSFPNEVRVRVQPQTPMLVLVSPKGELLPVTDEAKMLSPLEAGELPDIPLLRGQEFYSSEEKRKRVVEFVQDLPEKGALNRRNISEIGWSKDEGYSVTLIQPKVEVNLGESQIDIKVMRVNHVLNYLSTHELQGRVIDASFSKKVLVRLRKAP